VSNGRDSFRPSRFEVARSTLAEVVPDPFAPSGPRRGRKATAPSLQAAAPRKRKQQSEEYPMHYIAEDLDTDAWVKGGLARLERYLASWRLVTELYPADTPDRNHGDPWTEQQYWAD
jgi:hypothetical protein